MVVAAGGGEGSRQETVEAVDFAGAAGGIDDFIDIAAAPEFDGGVSGEVFEAEAVDIDGVDDAVVAGGGRLFLFDVDAEGPPDR